MITSIRVYADLTPWDSWEPFIRAEMARVGIPYSKRKTVTVVCCPLSMMSRRKSQIRDAEAQSVSGQK